MTRCMSGLKHLCKEDEQAKASNRRTSAGNTDQLYGLKKDMDKRIKECKQVYARCCHCLQPQKMVELRGAKTKNSSNGYQKKRRRPLFFVFDDVALTSKVYYKNSDIPLSLTQIKKPAT